jgi:preprotein translocase subunit YajC
MLDRKDMEKRKQQMSALRSGTAVRTHASFILEQTTVL